MMLLPIVGRELRTAARKKSTWWVRVAAAAMALFLGWVIFQGSSATQSPASVAKEIFGLVSGAAWLACLSAGLFLTADCLSEEKREDTLGLLFLTDLKGYDVVLGKLAAKSLHAVYGLVAMFPILGLTLLMGGVTGAEFGRVLLVLLLTLFFSLSVSLLISAASRDARHAMGGTLLVLVSFNVLPVALDEVGALYFKGGAPGGLLWISPMHALRSGIDAYYRTRSGPADFWSTICVLSILSLAALAAAAVVLPRNWQVGAANAKGSERAVRALQLRFGVEPGRSALRRKLLARDPFLWVCLRDRLPKYVAWMLIFPLLALWGIIFSGIFIAPGSMKIEAYSASMFVALGVNLILKYLMAWEASRRLHADRQSGALELLLATPLPQKSILRTQMRALHPLFLPPMIFMLVVGCGVYVASKGPKFTPGFTLADPLSGIAALSWMGTLYLDFQAISWTAMLMGLRMRTHQMAVLATLGMVLALPWLGWVLLNILVPIHSTTQERILLIAWYCLAALWEIILIRSATKSLRRDFRALAAGLPQYKRGQAREFSLIKRRPLGEPAAGGAGGER